MDQMTTDAARVLHVPKWTLGDRLRKAREDAGIGSTEMARRLHLTRQTITNYERGHRPPAWLTLKVWAEMTEVDLDWLIGDALDENGRSIKNRCFSPPLQAQSWQMPSAS